MKPRTGRGRRLTTARDVAVMDRRLKGVRPPVVGFDPFAGVEKLLSASRAALPAPLARYRPPFLPPENAHPALRELRRAMLSPSTRGPFEIVVSAVSRRAVAASAAPPAGRADAPAGRLIRSGRLEKSANWSGVCIKAPRSRPFVQVAGAWTVPDIAPPPMAKGRRSPAGRFRSSVWVGLDGHGRSPGESLAQIGTAQQLETAGGRTKKVFVAWFQWWVRGHHFPPVPLADFPVRPGDPIVAGVTAVPPDVASRYPILQGSVLMHLKNRRTGRLAIVYFPAPRLGGRGETAARTRLKGATAEWIVERSTRHPVDERPLHPIRPNKGKPYKSTPNPVEVGRDPLYRLPDYGSVRFDTCLALSAPRDGGPLALHDLRDARRIRMYELREDPHRVAFVSNAEKIDDASALVSYLAR
ncbi:MAG: G1 family endopeptidase [Alphaproteobacteria bacterium]|nr:G1 family endopeptidase [Alphaproteobacteria bacterium]